MLKQPSRAITPQNPSWEPGEPCRQDLCFRAAVISNAANEGCRRPMGILLRAPLYRAINHRVRSWTPSLAVERTRLPNVISYHGESIGACFRLYLSLDCDAISPSSTRASAGRMYMSEPAICFLQRSAGDGVKSHVLSSSEGVNSIGTDLDGGRSTLASTAVVLNHKPAACHVDDLRWACIFAVSSSSACKCPPDCVSKTT